MKFDNAIDPFDELSVDEIRAMVITAATNLARRWIPSVPGAQAHIDADAETAVEVKLSPSIGVSLILIDSDGTRYPLAWRNH